MNSCSLSPGDDVGVVHEHHHAERAGPAHQREHARIGDVELLGVRMQLEHLHAARRDPGHLVQRGLAVVGMHRADRQHLRMLRCQRDQRVVTRPRLFHVALQRLVGPTEPHATEAADLPLSSFDLRLVLGDGLLTLAQVDMHVEHGLLRKRCLGNKEEQCCSTKSLHRVHFPAASRASMSAFDSHRPLTMTPAIRELFAMFVSGLASSRMRSARLPAATVPTVDCVPK